MNGISTILTALASFIIILVASNKIGGLIKYLKLPLITGLLFMGIITGPELLNIINKESLVRLNFINHISLSFIAFAAGTELYLLELRSRMKSIKWVSAGKVIFTLVLGAALIYLLTRWMDFGISLDKKSGIAIAVIISTIFIARSPVSAIAIINELKARGPFTKMVLGVTVLTDFLVIAVFSMSFSLAISLTTGESFSFTMLLIMIAELSASLFGGYLLFLLLKGILSLYLHNTVKAVLILGAGWSIYFVSDQFMEFLLNTAGITFHLEPLLVCITASLLITNRSKYRKDFQKIINDVVPYIYVAFFTLIGASLSLSVLKDTWAVAMALVGVRIIVLFAGTWTGGQIAGDPGLYNRTSWMTFITQAGVALGLVSIVSKEIPEWGVQFATIVVAVIIINQIIGPPLFKWAIQLAGEDHSKAAHDEFAGPKKAIIFGYEQQSLTLAKQLTAHNWIVNIISSRDRIKEPREENINIIKSPETNLSLLKELETSNADAVITMRTDEENLSICELIQDCYCRPELIVRLNSRNNFSKFHKLGARVVEPNTAVVSLLDNFTRSPIATSLLLGMDKGQVTEELEVRNKEVIGLPLRDLHLPVDILIIATHRKGHNIISTGYTRLRKKDKLTLVGSPESIEEVRLRFE